jgi:hypothetical protein
MIIAGIHNDSICNNPSSVGQMQIHSPDSVLLRISEGRHNFQKKKMVVSHFTLD